MIEREPLSGGEASTDASNVVTSGQRAAQPSIGAILRQAREALGLSVQDAATRLRLMNRQIEAMEEDDFALLGQPVFARGFVRNYARLLQLDPAQVLQHMGSDRVEPGEVRIETPVAVSRPRINTSWLLIGLVGVLVLIAIPVLLYFWLNSGEVEVAQPTHPAPRSATAAALTSASRVTPAASAATIPPPTNAVLAPIALTTTTTLQAAPLQAATPTTPAVPPQTVAPALAVPSPAPVAVPVTPAAPVTPVTASMHFEFAEDAWVEIRDGTGKMVHRQMDHAGSSADVSGQPPFNLVIGNAAHVSMTYNGRPLDIKPFIDITVARFTLEQ
jgi:cytoskeleton protein RodZ